MNIQKSTVNSILTMVVMGPLKGLFIKWEKATGHTIGDPKIRLGIVEQYEASKKKVWFSLVTFIIFLALIFGSLNPSWWVWLIYLGLVVILLIKAHTYLRSLVQPAVKFVKLCIKFAKIFGIEKSWSNMPGEPAGVHRKVVTDILELCWMIKYNINPESKASLRHLLGERLEVAEELKMPIDPLRYKWAVEDQKQFDFDENAAFERFEASIPNPKEYLEWLYNKQLVK